MSVSQKDYDRLYAESEDKSAFSNGTEWEIWSYNWCHRCMVDAPFRNGIAKTGCPLILIAMLGRTPLQWLRPDDMVAYPRDYHCIEFRAPGDGGGEPKPKPTPPGQSVLFEREQVAGRRMLTSAEPVRETVDA